MENKKTKPKLKKNYLVVLALLLLIIFIFSISTKHSKKKKLVLSDFEKIAINNYLQNEVIDINKIQNLAGGVDEQQLFQSNLKQALDKYFSENGGTEVASSEVMGLMESIDASTSIDLHGVQVSDYKYVPERDVFVKSPGYNSGLANNEANIPSRANADQKVRITTIEKNSNDKYKVYFDIVSEASENSVISSGEANLVVENNNIKMESYKLY